MPIRAIRRYNSAKMFRLQSAKAAKNNKKQTPKTIILSKRITMPLHSCPFRSFDEIMFHAFGVSTDIDWLRYCVVLYVSNCIYVTESKALAKLNSMQFGKSKRSTCLLQWLSNCSSMNIRALSILGGASSATLAPPHAHTLSERPFSAGSELTHFGYTKNHVNQLKMCPSHWWIYANEH